LIIIILGDEIFTVWEELFEFSTAGQQGLYCDLKQVWDDLRGDHIAIVNVLPGCNSQSVSMRLPDSNPLINCSMVFGWSSVGSLTRDVGSPFE
jgi:hypothetical protein